jgi:hypothetical protein
MKIINKKEVSDLVQVVSKDRERIQRNLLPGKPKLDVSIRHLFIFILFISYCFVSFRVYGENTKPTNEIEMWMPVQVRSCPDIRIPPMNKWKYQDGFRQYRSEIDVDGDEKPDVIEAEDRFGSTQGLTSITLTLGSTGESIEADYSYSFELFVSETSIPDKLIEPKYRCALRVVEEVLFHGVSDKIDPSLEWLLEKKKHLRWVEGPPVLPQTYTVRVKTSNGGNWISYLGRNHSYRGGKGPYKSVVLDQKGNYVLLGTSHGVILTDPERSKHAWIYIFPGGAKLRWPSIRSARIEGETAIVQLEKDPSGRKRATQVRINLKTGIILFLGRMIDPTKTED